MLGSSGRIVQLLRPILCPALCSRFRHFFCKFRLYRIVLHSLCAALLKFLSLQFSPPAILFKLFSLHCALCNTLSTGFLSFAVSISQLALHFVVARFKERCSFLFIFLIPFASFSRSNWLFSCILAGLRFVGCQ